MINRRQFIKSISAAGIAGMAGFPFASHASQAMVNGKPSRLLLVMMNGGYAPIQTSAASFVNNTAAQMSFGLSAAEASQMPIQVMDEISYDVASWGALPQVIWDRFACIGTIGASNHNSAHHFWKGAEGGLAQAIAAKMGGSSAIKAAKVGDVIGASDGESVAGVALEPVKSLSSALETLTGKGQAIAKEDRPIMGRVVQETYDRFQALGHKNRDNLGTLINGYQNLANSMLSPTAEVDAAEIQSAYGAVADSNGLSNKLGIVEGLFRSGVNVVCVGEGSGTYWDTHDDNDGSRSRNYFNMMVPGLSKFGERMLGREDMNVTIVFVSEHSRIPLINNHGPHLSTIVISDNAIAGKSTGITDNGGLIPDAESKPIQAWKAAIGELVGLTGTDNPFGAAPQHRRIIKHQGV